MFSFFKPLIVGMKIKASHMAYTSPFYDWSLSGSIYDRFDVILNDLWPGDSGRGRWLCNGHMDCGGSLNLMSEEDMIENGNALTATYWQSFEWLRDLKALGGDMGRKQARVMINKWIHHHKHYDAGTWQAGILGRRISFWITHYDFFGASADNDFQEAFFKSLSRQYRHLTRVSFENLKGIESFYALKGLIYAHLSLTDQRYKLGIALDKLEKVVEEQILSDGMHISRSPSQLFRVINILLDIRLSLSTASHPIPDYIETALDRAIPALKFFKYPDGRLGLFNGSVEENQKHIDICLKRAGARGRVCSSLPEAGFERIAQGKTTLICDTGLPNAPQFTQYNQHAAPLSFEMTYGKERLFTHCGSHTSDPAWRDMLRSTAAHNTLTLDDRNAYEIKECGNIGRRVTENNVDRETFAKAILLTADHNGYTPICGMNHQRRLYVSDNGTDIRGEDIIARAPDYPHSIDHKYAVRFHLHPRVQASLVNQGQEILLKLPSGAGFRFSSKNAGLSLEDSIYCGKGADPRKTKQIVLSGLFIPPATPIKWAVQAV